MRDITHRLRTWTHAVDAVPASDLMDEAADEIDRLREWNEEAQSRASISELAIRRLAEQDATLSVVGGAVQVTMDATLTDAEREAVERAAQWMVQLAKDRGEIHSAGYFVDDAATLRGLLERLK